MNNPYHDRAVGLVREALNVLRVKPPERWGLKSPIIEVVTPDTPGAELSKKIGVNFQVIVPNKIGKMIGIALEVIDENGKPCAQRSARVHGVDYLIQQVRVFCSDSLEKLDKVIRRVVECINRTLNTIERKRASRSQWCDMTRKQKKFLYNRPSRTLVVPEFNLRSQIVLVQV